MNINLLKLFELCGKHKLPFTYKNSGEEKNSIFYDLGPLKVIKGVNVIIVDPDDENLPNLIDKRIQELKDIFK